MDQDADHPAQPKQPCSPSGQHKEATQIKINFEHAKMRRESVKPPRSQSPADDEFEDNFAEELQDVKLPKGYHGHHHHHQRMVRRRQTSGSAGGIVTVHELTSYEQSPLHHHLQDQRFNFEDVNLHKDAYNIVYKHYPPNPILPKSTNNQESSPRSGGEFAFLKLIKFRGKDYGKSKFQVDYDVNHVEFPDTITLKSLFHPMEGEENMTPFGEIVFLRSALDFSQKNPQPGMKKDEVLEENLIDVRKILKNSQVNRESLSPNKKGLLNLQGVDQFYKKKGSDDRTLIFESRFESGNLAASLRVSSNEYHLLLQNDVNTSGHTQWFFFRVSNTTKNMEVRFNMLNLSKPDSLFNEGMKVLIYSDKNSEMRDIGWYRGGTKISYYQNGIRKEQQKRFKSYYTLTFTYEFEYDDDTVYFAYCYPYTYSDLQDDLNRITNDPIKGQICKRKTLCQSLAGNKLEMLTITSRQNLENMPKRKGIYLTSRVHPGESVGSWMMKGAIDFLTDETNEEAELLRQNFVFKILPMLNPDGVINGNYRCSLAGCDLNRRWKAPSKVLHPEIYYTKQMMQKFAQEREMIVFCDFHGHSRRKNIFMYGCNNPMQPEETRLFPFLLSKICPFFVYNLSRFGNQKSKEATARIAMFNELKIPSIFTMESSFCGNDQGPFANYHFSTDNLMQTGRDFCRTLFLYCSVQVPRSIADVLMNEIQNLYDHYRNESDIKDVFIKAREVEPMKFFTEKINQYKEKGVDINSKHIRKALLLALKQTQDLMNDGETTMSSAGSDQAPSEDNLEPEEIQMVVPIIDEESPLGSKSKKRKGKDQAATNQDMATSVSPLRRKTMVDNAKVRQAALNAAKQSKRMSLLRTQKTEGSNSKVILTNAKNTIEESTKNLGDESNTEQLPAGERTRKNTEGQTDFDKLAVEAEEATTLKKKRRRNVESKDAWTQTERSDYMMIKYRHRQKLALQMARSQKFTKEEQMIYDQVMEQQRQQKMAMNKTQEINTQNGIKNNIPGKMLGMNTISFYHDQASNQSTNKNADHSRNIHSSQGKARKLIQPAKDLPNNPVLVKNDVFKGLNDLSIITGIGMQQQPYQEKPQQNIRQATKSNHRLQGPPQPPGIQSLQQSANHLTGQLAQTLPSIGTPQQQLRYQKKLSQQRTRQDGYQVINGNVYVNNFTRENPSDLSSTHSTHRIGSNIGGQHLEAQTFSGNGQPKDQRNVKILENAYIQQKLQQSEQQVNKSMDFGKPEDNIPIKNNLGQGNFLFSTSGIVQGNKQSLTQKPQKRKSTDAYSRGNTNIMSAGMQGQSIRKMIENSWKAVQQQHMQQQQIQNSNVFQGSFQLQPHAMKYGTFSSKPGPGVRGSTNKQKQQTQFINIQRPQTGKGSGDVKISIVNVHNEFNIHNNIIISNPGVTVPTTKQGPRDKQGLKKK